ncbi:fungal-specific transcription factor domain-containing protein [Microdochium trichocladiopsis]|uniref:Fungal-specific transcription factor domain-containing protein n=1 Tax=Microdochium trichocladiopsis TaxID=1682393 RepID=A0A9P9BJD6_9PEZI|nr:fungal-specific transcription factor domain-containing protein [Microdochium trichocladiopsis]KAH7025118.1 fungal-specific transcription factor domain-containing protein [Microdochium trichocladiopsis]
MARPFTLGDGVDGLKIWAELHKLPEAQGRLRHLEALISDLGSQVEVAVSGPIEDGSDCSIMSASSAAASSQGRDTNNMSTTSNMTSEAGNHMAVDQPSTQAGPDLGSGGLATCDNGDLIVEDRFWTIFCSEVEQIFDAVRDHSRPPFFTQHDSSERPHVSYFSYLLGRVVPGNNSSSLDLFPMPSQMLFIWQTFEERVDPIIKLLHKPSMVDIIRNLTGDWSRLDAALAALVLAVSFAAVAAFDEDEVPKNFGSSKSEVLARYRLGAEQAFQQCDLLTTKDLGVLQAYVIYLNVLVRGGDAERAWPLIGMLVRLAVRLQLHRDSSQSPGFSSFDVEMRRRLWWQICLLDSHLGAGAPRSSNFLISQDMFDTARPLNIDDAALGPNSMVTDTETTGGGRTDMTPTLARLDTWTALQGFRSLTTATALSPSSSTESLGGLLQHASILRQTYTGRLSSADALRHPLDRYLATMARLSFARIELFLRQHGLPPADPAIANAQPAREVIQPAVFILEDVVALHQEPAWKRWRWLLPPTFSTPWVALHVALKYISGDAAAQSQGSHGSGGDGDDSLGGRALSAVERAFGLIPDEAKTMPQYAILLDLHTRAAASRAAAAVAVQQTLQPPGQRFDATPAATHITDGAFDIPAAFASPEMDPFNHVSSWNSREAQPLGGVAGVIPYPEIARGENAMQWWQAWEFADWIDF